MDRIDCDECKYGYYEGDKLRCELELCKPNYFPHYYCIDCKNFYICEETKGELYETCLYFELSN